MTMFAVIRPSRPLSNPEFSGVQRNPARQRPLWAEPRREAGVANCPLQAHSRPVADGRDRRLSVDMLKCALQI